MTPLPRSGEGGRGAGVKTHARHRSVAGRERPRARRPLRADRHRPFDHLRPAGHRELRARRVLHARRLFRADPVSDFRLARRHPVADHRRLHRHDRRTHADPPALRQGAAAQPDHHLRPRAADRGDRAPDLGRHRPAVQSAAVPVRLPDLGADPDHQVPLRRAVHHSGGAVGAMGLPPTPSSAASCAPARAIPRWSACSASTCRAC